jgi:hypothetical protein
MLLPRAEQLWDDDLLRNGSFWDLITFLGGLIDYFCSISVLCLEEVFL